MIKFLRDYRTQSIPPEVFTEGQIVEDRSSESELHFVKRGVAAYVDKNGALTDHEGREVAAEVSTNVEVIDVANNRDGEAGRAGEVELTDGTPQRASSGPGTVATSAELTVAKPAKPSRRAD